jgi:hypothetical protein
MSVLESASVLKGLGSNHHERLSAIHLRAGGFDEVHLQFGRRLDRLLKVFSRRLVRLNSDTCHTRYVEATSVQLCDFSTWHIGENVGDPIG